MSLYWLKRHLTHSSEPRLLATSACRGPSAIQPYEDVRSTRLPTEINRLRVLMAPIPSPLVLVGRKKIRKNWSSHLVGSCNHLFTPKKHRNMSKRNTQPGQVLAPLRSMVYSNIQIDWWQRLITSSGSLLGYRFGPPSYHTVWETLQCDILLEWHSAKTPHRMNDSLWSEGRRWPLGSAHGIVKSPTMGQQWLLLLRCLPNPNSKHPFGQLPSRGKFW